MNCLPDVHLSQAAKNRSCTSTSTSHHNHPAPSTRCFLEILMPSFSNPCQKTPQIVSYLLPPSPVPCNRQPKVLRLPLSSGLRLIPVATNFAPPSPSARPKQKWEPIVS